MDKSKTSITRMGKKEKYFSNFINIPISLTRMLTHGHKTARFGHFIPSFLEMGSNFTTTSLAKCLRTLYEPIIDKYGDFIYKSGSSKHQLHDSLLQSESWEKRVIYKNDVMQHDIVQCMPNRKLPPIILFWKMDNFAFHFHFYLF